jgi:hypothetical protein
MQDLTALSSSKCERRAIQLRARPLHRSALRFLLLMALVFPGSSFLFSQQFATLNLTVADPAGRVIAQANVPFATWIRE